MTHKQFAWTIGIAHALLVPCILLGAIACAALRNVTPADRASAYAREAQGMRALCKAYAFDRASGLVGEVPTMAQACGGGK